MSPVIPLRPMTTDEQVRFWLRTKKQPNGCIEWTRAATHGYGRVFVSNRLALTHRVALVTALGRDLNPDSQVDHLCRNTLCCNPDHLEEVAPLTNFKRGVALGAQLVRAAEENGICLHGHPVSTALAIRPGRGYICAECERLRNRVRFANRSDADRERRRIRAANARAAKRLAQITGF